MTKKFILYLLSILQLLYVQKLEASNTQPQFSTAGFFELPQTGRHAYNMNPAWRFYKGDCSNGQLPSLDDKTWELVSLPHGIELLPTEGSGCINYQGPVWYRKHFKMAPEWAGKRIFLHFEAIMGKSKVWINGHLVNEYFGGYLPVIADLTPYLHPEEDNIIAVRTDNSDDPMYPPGKSQDVLDFTYAGGIYRDCWLVTHHPVYITDANYENEPASGGLFVSFGKISTQEAEIRLDIHLRNTTNLPYAGEINCDWIQPDGKKRFTVKQKINMASQSAKKFTLHKVLSSPHLWTPDDPYLYNLHIYLKDRHGRIIDGYKQRIGVRSIEFKGENGFWLNGKPYPFPLIGGNRHQDFAVIGNALPNSLHWRDAKKLRDAGMRVIRNAHYPQDPAFMDACDELGLFVIVNTPGWQFWNKEPIFEKRVYQDIRNMVRRDRNHPSVWLWEPILNETWYPEIFAQNVLQTLNQEYPYPYCYAACDVTAKGHEYFKVQYTHPPTGGGGAFNTQTYNPEVSYFTREWGDNVDDWFSHNSPSRVYRGWGEIPMLVQAQGYAKTDYQYTSYDVLYRTSRQHMGGCLWHPFDHQRGYHPDPFYGGIMDAFRQPKLAYYLFCAQRPATVNPHLKAETGPMIYIANQMTPFSPRDVTIYSNCDEVRLTYGTSSKTWTYHKTDTAGMPSPIITFPDVFDVMTDKQLSRAKRQKESFLFAEGLVDGKVVATHKVMPSRRPSRIRMWVDDEKVGLKADGSDMVVVVAAITDEKGQIKRLNNQSVYFEVEGPGRLVSDIHTQTNPRAVSWGTAPVLVQATTQPGIIRIKASVLWQGSQTPVSAILEIPSTAVSQPIVADPEESMQQLNRIKSRQSILDKHQARSSIDKLEVVAKQQSDFE